MPPTPESTRSSRGRSHCLGTLLTQLRQVQHTQIQQSAWFDEETDRMVSMVAEVNKICERIVPYIRLQPPATARQPIGPFHQQTFTQKNDPSHLPSSSNPTNQGSYPHAAGSATYQSLLDRLLGGHSLTSHETALALEVLTPSCLDRMGRQEFVPLLPFLVNWLREPTKCYHAFLIINEGYSRHPSAANCDESIAVLHALNWILENRSLMNILGKRHIDRDTVMKLQHFLASHLDTTTQMVSRSTH